MITNTMDLVDNASSAKPQHRGTYTVKSDGRYFHHILSVSYDVDEMQRSEIFAHELVQLLSAHGLRIKP